MNARDVKSAPLLVVKSVKVGYDSGSEVIHDIDLVVREGELVTVIGPNGAGKSTLLNAIMGHLIPKAGSVQFEGCDITSLRPHRRVERGLGLVPQVRNVFPSLTVEENLVMGGITISQRRTKHQMEKQYELFPRLAERRGQRVKTLSGGERQMLAIARALMTDPKLLLLDEPTAALSPRLVEEVFNKIKSIAAEKRAILLVEQNVQLALNMSDRGVIIANGQKAFDGRATELLESDDSKMRDAYLGAA